MNVLADALSLSNLHVACMKDYDWMFIFQKYLEEVLHARSLRIRHLDWHCFALLYRVMRSAAELYSKSLLEFEQDYFTTDDAWARREARADLFSYLDSSREVQFDTHFRIIANTKTSSFAFSTVLDLHFFFFFYFFYLTFLLLYTRSCTFASHQ